jgi:hypothetical protein
MGILNDKWSRKNAAPLVEVVEVGGIEPPSENLISKSITCVSVDFCFNFEARPSAGFPQSDPLI